MTSATDDVFPSTLGLAELHTHLGGSVPMHILWELAHAQGISLPTKSYWEFAGLVRVGDDGVDGLTGLDDVYKWCELIQSSPMGVERSVHAMIGGAYRTQKITTLEVRFNPAKRNRGGEQDLDHVILAASRAVDRARLEYPEMRVGLVLMCDRTFDRSLNEIIVEKALRWRDRSVVGVDLGGPRPEPGPYPYHLLETAFAAARAAGLGVTVHCGEEGPVEEVGEVVERLRPQRIGHGVLASADTELVRMLARRQVVLEICPTSNLRTGVESSIDGLVERLRVLRDGQVKLTVSTDGPVMMGTSLRDEHALLVRAGLWDTSGARQANEVAHAASFCAPRY